MKYIKLKPFYGKLFEKNNIFKIDNGDNVFFRFEEKIIKQGIEIDTLDVNNNKRPDVIIYCDIPYPWQFRQWKSVLSKKPRHILFTFESPLVNPFSHMKVLHQFFDKVITWNDSLVDNNKSIKFNIPQRDLFPTSLTSYSNKKLITVINSNKNIPLIFKLVSPYKNDLYKERIKAIKFFQNIAPRDFDLWGKGWSKESYPSYRGTIEQGRKLEVLKNYKFSLVFENTEAPGYITEKLFDCFKSGVVPIYRGAPNVKDYIPKGSFIDAKEFLTYSDLYNFITNMKSSDYLSFQKEGDMFVKSKRTKELWFEDGFVSLFTKVVNYK